MSAGYGRRWEWPPAFAAALSSAVLVLLAAPTLAAAPPAPISVEILAGRVSVRRAGEIVVAPLPCTARLALADAHRLHVVCGSNRLLTLRLLPWPTLRVATELRVEGHIRALYLREGRVWAERERVDAQPITQLAAKRPSQHTRPFAHRLWRTAGGVVLQRTRDGAIVTFKDGAQPPPGQRFAFTTADKPRSLDRTSVVGAVVRSIPGRALVALHPNELAQAGTMAVPTNQDISGGYVFPVAVPQRDAARVALKALVSSTPGATPLHLSGAVERRLGSFLRAEAVLHDLAVAASGAGAGVVVSVGLRGWLQGRFAAIGGGLGWYGAYSDWRHNAPWLEVIMRFGARDGLRLQAAYWYGWRTAPYGGRIPGMVGWMVGAQVPVPFARHVALEGVARSSLAGYSEVGLYVNWRLKGGGATSALALRLGLGFGEMLFPGGFEGWTGHTGIQFTLGMSWRR